eukprot:2478800-Amphidinium_carterae.1
MGASKLEQADLDTHKQNLSRQLYYILVLICTDHALDIIKSVEEGCGAEAWRKLSHEFEPSSGARFGALLQNMLRREFGTKAEIDLVREIEQLDMDIKKYQDQS